MEGLKMIPFIALMLAVAGIVIGAGVISLDKMGNSVDKCFNSSWTYTNATGNYCKNVTTPTMNPGPHIQNYSAAWAALQYAENSSVDISEQLPTVAIIGIMVIIISIIAGVFVYMRYFG